MKALIFFVLLGLSALSSWKIQYEFPYTQSVLYVPPPRGMEHFAFGYKPALADSLWIRAIQDFAVCENTLDSQQKEKKECNKAWLYQMLDQLTDLDPKFRLAYSLGATSLSVFVEDKAGATALFDKGIRNFPNDWIIPYRGAYHAIYEVKDNGKGAELLEIAAKNGAPIWTQSLAARLYTEAGKKELGEAIIQQMIERGEPPELIERTRQKVNEAAKDVESSKL